MLTVAVVLLGMMLLVLIGMLTSFWISSNDLQKYVESIHRHIFESKESLQLLLDRVSRLSENVEAICGAVTDIRFKQENLEKYEIATTIKTLENIELGLFDFKPLHDMLSSIEHSLDVIVAHPAFTSHHDDLL